MNNPSDIRQAVGQRKQGETLQVKLRHGDAEKTLSVALGEKNGRAYMGVLLLPEGRERTGMLGPRAGFRRGPFPTARSLPGSFPAAPRTRQG